MASPEELLEAIERAPSLSVASPVIYDDLAPPDEREALPLSRIRAARSWLFALGYLKEDVDSTAYDPALRAAVTTFQREAGLTVDGWIGQEETWPRLRELVAFEATRNPLVWTLPEGGARPALRRAAQARLAVYGFGKPGAKPDDAVLEAEITRFFAVLRRMGEHPPEAGAGEVARLLYVLDHDAHEKAVARRLPEDPARALFQLQPRREDTLALYGFLLNFAKVELWMVQVEGVELPTVYEGTVQVDGRYFPPPEIDRGLRRYFDTVGEDKPGQIEARRAFEFARVNGNMVGKLAAFFAASERITAPEGEGPVLDVDDLNAFYNDRRHGTARAEASSEELQGKRGLRSRLWDGLRRLWTWIRDTVRKAIALGRKALDVARNIARAAFRIASDGFFYVGQIARAFVEHFAVGLSWTHRERLGRVVVRREFGRDMNLVVAPAAPVALAPLYAGQLALSARIFRCACRILGKLIGFAVSLAAGIAAAPLALRALVWAAFNAREVIGDFRRIAALAADHKLGAAALAEL